MFDIKNATIETVALEAGVAVGTVSRHINGYKVRPDNAKKIEDAIKKLDFTLNQQARGLKMKKSFTIALLFPSITDIFATQVIEGVEEYAERSNYSVIICNSMDSIEKERNRIDFINSKRVDGIIMMPISDDSIEAIKNISNDIPYVIIDKKVKDLDADYILCNNYEGTYTAVNKIIEQGHHNIAIIGGSENVYTAKERMRGYIQALEENNINLNENYIRRGLYQKNGGLEDIKFLMDLKDPPTAIFATNFEITMSVIKYFMAHDIEIGKDVSLLGYDNIDVFQMLTPTISAVEQPMIRIGNEAGKLLVHKMNNKEEEVNKVKILETVFINGMSIHKV